MDILSFIGEISIAVVKHGWSASTLVIFIFALFKFAPFRRFVMRNLPKKLRMLDNRMDSMDVRMKRMESKIDDIARHMEVPKWDARYAQVSKLQDVTDGRKNSLKPTWAMFALAPIIGAFTSLMGRLYRSKTRGESIQMTKDILSGKKKFLALIIAIVINGLNDALGLNLSVETLDAATYISGGFIAIEGILDIIRALSNHFLKKNNAGGTKNADFETPIEPRV